MNSYISKLEKIINLGLVAQTDSWLAGKIRVVNIMCLLTLSMVIFMILIDLIITKNHFISIVAGLIGVIMILPYYLNYKKCYVLSRIIFLSFSYFFICLLAIVFGKEFYFQYYLVPGVGMSLIFFRDEIGNKKWIFSLLGIPLWIFLELWFLKYPPLLVIEGKYIQFIPYFSSFLIFITAIMMFATFTHENDKQLKNIHNMNIKLKELANTDSLTGLYNRRYVDKHLINFFDIASRENSYLALVIFDIDFFKKVNDTYGHDAGDKVLQMLSKLAREEFRESDLIGRIGGEEFCIAFTYGNREKTKKAIERFRKAIENEVIKYEDLNINITSSFGIAYYSNDINSYKDLFKNADEALYEAKRSGRNRICEYTSNY